MDHIQYLYKQTTKMEMQNERGGQNQQTAPSNAPYQNLSEENQYLSGNQYPHKPDDTLAHLGDGLAGSARTNFIKKVYMVLGMQLLITAGMCFLSYFVPSFLAFQIQNQWLMWVSFVFLIMSEIAILCVPAGRQFPLNLVLLLVFTLCQSYTVSYICSIVAEENGSMVVVTAAAMTVAIVFALTVYAIFTKQDFTTKWGILIVILMAMLMLGIFSLFVRSPFLDNLYCCLGVIVFGIYIVIDTQLIIGGRRMEISMDDYVIGAMILYIDIIQLFLYLLRILSKK